MLLLFCYFGTYVIKVSELCELCDMLLYEAMNCVRMGYNPVQTGC